MHDVSFSISYAKGVFQELLSLANQRPLKHLEGKKNRPGKSFSPGPGPFSVDVMRSRPRRSPPEAMPFSRGRSAASAPPKKGTTPVWIDLEVWSSLAAASINAHRLASGSGGWLERFGSDLLLSYQSEQARDVFLAEMTVQCSRYSFVPRRVFGKFLPHHAAERTAPALLRGPAGESLETEVEEAGVRYGLDFATGYSAGLFIDQRANRAFLRTLQPRQVLNTFAYTCSFSVVGALAGAETVSLDLSRRSLDRGKANFERNGLQVGAGHRFIADDVLAVLPRLERRGEKFDAIVLDPPTFSRNQEGEAFQVQRDFDRLLGLALGVAAPGAHLLLSVNHSAMRGNDLERIARNTLKMCKRSGQFTRPGTLPDFPAGSGAQTLWLEVG